MLDASKLTSDPVLQDIADSLGKMKMKIYQIYPDNDLAEKPAIHIVPESVQKKALVMLVNCIGRYNLASPDNEMVLRPHNYGDWESYLSLEPASKCRNSELGFFSDFLRQSIRSDS